LATRRKSMDVSLNLPSLVDVVFLLLIFFMLTTTFSKMLTKLDVKLPEARAVVEQKTKNTIIEVAEDGRLAMDGNLISIEELDKKLAELAKEKPDETIIIKADKNVRYGKVIEVMGICKSYNLNKLGMAALEQQT
jgi:biopolymer transport protein ExbD